MTIEEILKDFNDFRLGKMEKIITIGSNIYDVIAYRMNDPGNTIRIDVKRKITKKGGP